MKLQGVRPTVDQFLRVSEPYFAEHPAGGSLHIAVNDLNLSDADIEFCLHYALEKNDGYGAALALLLLHMSKSQRGRVAKRWGRARDAE